MKNKLDELILAHLENKDYDINIRKNLDNHIPFDFDREDLLSEDLLILGYIAGRCADLTLLGILLKGNYLDSLDPWNNLYAGKYIEALKQFRIRLLLDAENYDSLCGAATAYYRLNRFEESVKQWETTIKMDDRVENHFELGKAFAKLGKKGQALEQYRLLEKEEPNMAAELLGMLNDITNKIFISIK